MGIETAAHRWDAIVIGSGIGGMAAATSLAKVGKRRVLVFEKHSERGGLTHVFRRDGASWVVGVHYVGGMEPGSRPRSILTSSRAALSGGTRCLTISTGLFIPAPKPQN